MRHEVAAGSAASYMAGVYEDLPELSMIGDEDLREAVVLAWALALSETEYLRVSDIPCEGNPGEWVMASANQAHHLRAVARMARAMAVELREVVREFTADPDYVLAAGLVHDVGKPFEFSPQNQARWRANPGAGGLPALRHPIYGAHIALLAGLPERIVHVVAAHSMYSEGQFVKASIECVIVQHADYTYWKAFERAGLVVR